jgi:hypothetical protein
MASDDFSGPISGTAAPAAKPERDKFGFTGPIATVAAPSAPDIGQGTAAVTGLVHGASLGLGALAMPPEMLEPGVMEAMGYKSAEEMRKDLRKQYLERLRAAEAQYPKTTMAGEFAGGAMVPLPGGAGSTLLRRMGTQAVTGGALGGAASFGGEEAPTPGQFALSTGLGAVTGGAFPVVAKGLSVAGRAAAQRLGLDRLPWFRDAEREAAIRMTQAENEAAFVEREARARAVAEGRPYEPGTLGRADIGPGRPGMAIDVLGVPGQELGRAAANLSPVARATLEGPLYARRAGQLERVDELVRPTLNYPTAGQQREALARPSAATNQAYRIAREIGDGRIEITPPLQELAQTRVVQSAFRRIETDLADAHRIDTMQRQAQGLPPRQAPSLNDLSVWDLVKRKLDDMWQAAAKASNRTRSNLITDATRMLRTEMDRQVPEYADARIASRAEILARDAFEEGRAFLTRGDLHETQQALAQLATHSPQAIDAFRQGFTHAMLERMGKKATEGNLFAQIKATPDETARMTIALGAPMTGRLAQQRADETIMQRALQAVTGNSTTARQLQQMGIAGGGGALAGGVGLGYLTADEVFGIGHRLQGIAGGAGVGAAIPLVANMIMRRTHQPGVNVDIQVANQIARMLMSRDPGQLARLAQIANTQPALAQALRSIGDVLGPAAARGTVLATTPTPQQAGAAAP